MNGETTLYIQLGFTAKGSNQPKFYELTPTEIPNIASVNYINTQCSSDKNRRYQNKDVPPARKILIFGNVVDVVLPDEVAAVLAPIINCHLDDYVKNLNASVTYHSELAESLREQCIGLNKDVEELNIAKQKASKMVSDLEYELFVTKCKMNEEIALLKRTPTSQLRTLLTKLNDLLAITEDVPDVVTEKLIDQYITDKSFICLSSGRTTICELTMKNGFTVRGEASTVSDSPNEELGMALSEQKAREEARKYLAYMIQEQKHLLTLMRS